MTMTVGRIASEALMRVRLGGRAADALSPTTVSELDAELLASAVLVGLPPGG